MSPRDATAADLPALLSLEAECFGAEAWTEGMVREELNRPGGILLVVGTPVSGFIAAWAVLDELHVLKVGVSPTARRTGAASALHAEMLRRARPHASAGWLEVRNDNAGAIAFYERHGWQLVGRRPRYYADGMDARLYRLERLD